MKTKSIVLPLALLGLAAGSALATSQVNISGATLFADFFQSYASTNDYIDVDHNGVYGFDIWNLATPEQLAPTSWKSPTAWWDVIYRGTGSGQGLAEIINYCRRAPGMEIGNPSDVSTINRSKFWDGSKAVGDANPANPANAPTPIKSVDIATMDVPPKWFVVSGSAANAQWNRTPLSDGYGQGPAKSWDGTQSNKLKTLASTVDPSVVMNLNTTQPDKNTIFDTQIAWVPIAFIANQGTGIQNLTQEQLQYLYTTGRLPSGENLNVATRDPGSGTRNAAMNSLGIDPSWGHGDNVGAKINDQYLAGNLGPNHQGSNTGGSGIIEEFVKQDRLGVGYTGLMGASRAADKAQLGLFEIVNVKKTGGTQYVRPSITNVLHNTDASTGWQIGGAETFATVGDPFAAVGAAYGMDNQAAADYLRNIKFSIDDFVKAPEDPCHSMPGEYMAVNYTLMVGLDGVPSNLPSIFIANPNLKPGVQTFILNNNILKVPAYGSVAPAGKVPTRAQLTGGKTYSDGRTYLGTDDYYTDSSGAKIRAGANLSLRNRLTGDFNYDGKRDLDDVADMMLALANPRAFEAGNNNHGDGYVIPEIIGDFNGDGNFDANDIRYWADGLAIEPATGLLNRALGFGLVDAFSTTGNFFNTKLATGTAYKAGDSKADVAGSGKVYPGSKPVGADGVVNAKDIDYVCYVLRGGLRAAAFGQVLPVNTGVHQMKLDWRKPGDAVWMDLTCDMNGDMVIDGADIDEIVLNVLKTKYGDVNLDGRVDQTDLNIILNNMGKGPGLSWADGDMNGDGYVTQEDFDIAIRNRDDK
jgi:hypothetical protein